MWSQRRGGKKASVDFTKELPPIWSEWLQPAASPLWFMKMSFTFYMTLEKRKWAKRRSSVCAWSSSKLFCVWNAKLGRILQSSIAHNRMSVRSHRTAKSSWNFCSLLLCMCGAWLPLPGLGTICIMLKQIATVKMYKIFHFVVQVEANLQYL